MTKTFPKLTDDEIVKSLDLLINESDGSNDSTLKKEREKVQKYYDGDEPIPSSKGNSKYVSQDVFDSVESMKATLLETFAAGNEIGTFEPNGPNDVKHAKLAARWVDNVVFAQNDGFTVFEDVIADSLMHRYGVAKVWWDEKTDEIEEAFEGADAAQFMQLVSQEADGAIEIKDVDRGEDGLFFGTICRYEDVSQVRIEALPPEKFLMGPRARKTDDQFMAHEEQYTRSELRARGIDEDLIEEIGDTNAKCWETDPEVLQRFRQTAYGDAELTAFQEQVQKVKTHECYVDIDVDGKGTTQLWRILKAGKVILEKEKVRRRPFLVFAALRRAHSVIGSSYANKVIPTQNAKTVLTRGVLDHTVRTNNPRHEVLKGTLNNANEMTDNRFGGIVNVNRPNGIKALEQPPLNPYVFQTTQALDYQLESTTGVSKLSQGLNKDAVSKQNSGALVEQLTSMSMQRQKIIARAFAYRFLRKLYELVYEILMENDDRKHAIEIAGEWVDIEPQRWVKRKGFTVQLALGYGEKDRRAAEWSAYDQANQQNPLYGVEQRFNVWSRILELKGEKNPQDYLLHPSKYQPPQPDPLKMKELEIKAALAEADRMRVQIELLKVQGTFQLEENKHSTEMAQRISEHAIKSDQNDLAREEFAHKVTVDNRELDILEKAKDVRGIASPDA